MLVYCRLLGKFRNLSCWQVVTYFMFLLIMLALTGDTRKIFVSNIRPSTSPTRRSVGRFVI